jgi:Prion-inhibition and propagation
MASVAATYAGLEGFVGYVIACARVYKFCRRTICSVANIGRDAQYLENQFYIEHARFSAWTILHGLVEGRAISKALAATSFCIQEVQEAVQKILVNIKNVCEDIEGLSKKYDLTAETPSPKPDDGSPVPPPKRTDTSLESPAVAEELKRADTRQQNIKKGVHLYRKFQWAIQDFKRLQQLVGSLSRCNDQLDKFTHPLALGVAQEALVKLLPMPPLMETLESRVASIESYKTIASAPPVMKAAIDARIAAWRVEAAEAELGNHDIEAKKLHGMEGLTPAKAGERAIVGFDAADGRSQALLEWKIYDPGQISTSDAMKRVNAVVSILRAAPRNSGVLKGIGYLEDTHQKGTRSCIALLYELPPSNPSELGRLPRIRTLRQMLTRPKSDIQGHSRKQFPRPPLGKRFQLAAQIAEALGSIHNCGWLHKGMRPENIVFIGQRDMEIRDPYVLGWAYSRRNAVEEQTEAIFSATKDIKYYHHPNYLKGNRYCEYFDHYQLACLLIEISHWRLLTDIRGAIGPNLEGEEWSRKLVEHAEELKEGMGDIYGNVMVRLLRGLDPDAGGDFWFDVVWELRQCVA